MKKWISIFLGTIIIAFLGFNFFSDYSSKNEIKASDAVFNAIYKFEEGKYEDALDMKDGEDGFEQIVRLYGTTSVGKLAHLYAATSWLKEYNVLFDREKCQQGIQHLKYLSFNNSDVLKEKKECLLGDLFVESGSFNEGALEFMEAYQQEAIEECQPYYLFKAALAFCEDGRFPQAVDTLKQLIKKFPEHPYAEKAKQKMVAIKK